MPKRNSTNEKQPTATTILRRSPRFLQNNQVFEPEDPKTPKSETRILRVPFLCSPSFSSTRKVSSKKTQKHYQEEVPQKVAESNVRSKNSPKSNIGSRRSARLLGRSTRVSEKEGFSGTGKAEFSDTGFFADVERAQMGANSSKHSAGKFEKRVTRSSSRGNANEIAVKTSNGKCAEFSDKGVLSFEKKSKLVVNSSEQLMGKLKKKMTSRSHRGITGKHAKKNGGSKCNGFFECASTELLDKGVLSKEEKAKLGVDLSAKHTGKLQKRTVTVGGGEREGRDMHKDHKQIGVKRKRDQLKECRGIVQGWTNDQEVALQRAYFAAKPTPHFWKKVARLVPGKSAQDCFDKVHSDHLTPPQPQLRSRARTNSPSLSLSASELLNLTGPKIYRKQKSRLGQKKVRKLLQKNYQMDQNYAADLFSVLEPTFSPSMVLYTPDQNKEKPDLLKRCQQRSLSGHKKPISRNNSSYGATLVSPPVLKQVKNKVLHEKYIDQLHCREAKRRAAFARSAKCGRGKEGKKESYGQEMDSIKAAKNALVFDVRDAIDQFQHLQANAMSSFSDADDGVDSDEVEDED